MSEKITSPGTLELFFAPVGSSNVMNSIQATSIEEAVLSLYHAYQLHGDITVEPLTDGGQEFRNVTQIFAQGINNTFDDVEADWEPSGRFVIRGV